MGQMALNPGDWCLFKAATCAQAKMIYPHGIRELQFYLQSLMMDNDKIALYYRISFLRNKWSGIKEHIAYTSIPKLPYYIRPWNIEADLQIISPPQKKETVYYILMETFGHIILQRQSHKGGININLK